MLANHVALEVAVSSKLLLAEPAAYELRLR